MIIFRGFSSICLHYLSVNNNPTNTNENGVTIWNGDFCFRVWLMTISLPSAFQITLGGNEGDAEVKYPAKRRAREAIYWSAIKHRTMHDADTFARNLSEVTARRRRFATNGDMALVGYSHPPIHGCSEQQAINEGCCFLQQHVRWCVLLFLFALVLPVPLHLSFRDFPFPPATGFGFPAGRLLERCP